jgi:hypothetical protein
MQRDPERILRAPAMRFMNHYDWLPIIDSFRTLCLAPPREVLAVFNELRGWRGRGEAKMRFEGQR